MDFNKQLNNCLEQLHDLIYSLEEVKETGVFPEAFFEDNFEYIDQFKAEMQNLEQKVNGVTQDKECKELKEGFIEDRNRVEIIVEEERPEHLEERVLVQEKANVLSLEDQIAKRICADLKKALSLNDRFRFSRDLFGNSTQLMDETLDKLNTIHSYDESIVYVNSEFTWDWNSESVKAFNELLQKRFG